MKQQILQALKGAQADYAEIRIHRGKQAHVHYVGKELESIGESTGCGGCVRALVRGGWGFVSFNDLSDLPRYVAAACHQAALVARKEIRLAAIPVSCDTSRLLRGIDPAAVSLSDKEALTRKYNDLIRHAPKIQTSIASYRDSHGSLIFASTEGAYVEQEVIFCGVHVGAIAIDGANVQQAHESNADLRGFATAEHLEPLCEEVARRAANLLTAEPMKGGQYTVVLDPKLAGVFAHEAFGHLSEADFLYEHDELKELMKLGRRFGEDYLSIVDDPTLPAEAGSYDYDSEGTPARRTYLIQDGVLRARLHSRETAAKMNEEPTGNARALGHSHAPIVRMSNTFIEPREQSFETMLEGIDEGVYACGMLGGMTDLEMFTFTAADAYMIRKGKIAEQRREVMLTGNVFDTLKHIDAIGNDPVFYGGLGGCGKGGQSPLRVSTGGPHVRIRNVVIGGR